MFSAASSEENATVSPILAILIGVVAVLIIVAIAIIIVMRKQGRDPEKGKYFACFYEC